MGRVMLWVALWAAAMVSTGAAQSQGSEAVNEVVALNANAATAPHFFAVHGRRALIDGYSSDGLEVWAYPFQILRGYRVEFLHEGATTPIDGESVLSRLEYSPDAVTRVYVGADFIVREKLLVPHETAGAVMSYTVQSARPLEIVVHAVPVLNLMWPAALGGQSTRWNGTLGAFEIEEPLHGYTAVVASAETLAHDEVVNRTTQSGDVEIGLTLRPNAQGKASLFVALNTAHTTDPGAVIREMMHSPEETDAESGAHRNDVLLVKTPDEEVNRAFAWAEIALDQAWVCDGNVGCGFVAGYGPTRPQRRPQYDWFFAGDGLIAAEASLSAGDWKHAHDELEFILKYQDKKSGMIWHELSQSAGFIDWAGSYPYMFVHVDITFQFLPVAARYVQETGDTAFVREHWDALETAYRYCKALIDPATGLPRIPADKEGGNEQDRMSDDLGLSTSWAGAAEAMAEMAKLTGNPELSAEAARAAAVARKAIPGRYWDAERSFWISGHNVAGEPMRERRGGPVDAITMRVFSEDQNKAVLDRLASASFETDWGSRGIEAGSPEYDPGSYAKGSVSPLHTAMLAETFWEEHRPATGLSVWSTLVPLTWMDSLGHLHEVLAGDFFHAQMESVPEQTWSSAGFVTATVRGLLGLEMDARTRRVTFAPRLPATWADVTVEHVRVPGGRASLMMHRAGNQIQLNIDNGGNAFPLEFAPDLPLGAKVLHCALNGRAVQGRVEEYPQETVGRVAVDAPHGASTLTITTAGGIAVIPETTRPLLGDASTGVHIVGIRIDEGRFILDADVPLGRLSHVELESEWRMTHATGASLMQVGNHRARLSFAAEPGNAGEYRRAHVVVDVAR